MMWRYGRGAHGHEHGHDGHKDRNGDWFVLSFVVVFSLLYFSAAFIGATA